MKKGARFTLNSLIAVVILVFFFVIYNYFLLDSSIERIRLALNDVSQSKDVFESDSASYLMQDLLVTEIGHRETNLERLVASEAFHDISLSGKSADRKIDTKFLLQDILSAYEQERAPILRWLDGLSEHVTNHFYNALKFIQYLFLGSDIRKNMTEEDQDRQVQILRRAREFELNWKFQDAAKVYQFFIQQYPEYPKINLVRLYLMSVYLRSRDYSSAEQLFSEVNLTLASPGEIRLASSLQKKLSELRLLADKRKLLSEYIDQIKEPKGQSQPAETSSKTIIIERLRRAREGEMAKLGLTEHLFQLGILNLYLFDLENAQKTFQEVLTSNPSEEMRKQVIWIQGWIHLLQSNYEESRRLMRELLERFPQSEYGTLGAFGLAAVSERLGDYNEAAKGFEQLAQAVDSAKVSFLLKYRAGGVYLYDLHDFPKAQSLFSEARRATPASLLSNVFESEVFPSIQASVRDSAFQRFFQGDTATSKKFFEDVLRVNPDDAWGNCGYGLALYLDGEKEKGMSYVTRCRSLKKDEYTSSVLAFIMEKEGKREDAAMLYEEALHARREYVIALYNLGRIDIEEKRFEKALERLLEAKKGAGRSVQFLPLILNNLGIAYWQLGKVEKAEAQFLEALSLDLNFSDARSNLARLYQKQGKLDLAKQHMAAATPPRIERSELP